LSFKLQVLKTASVSTQQIAGIPCLAYRCFNMMSIYVLRLYVNTGALNSSVSSAGTTTPGYSLTVANNSFNATCSFTINYLNETAASGGLGSTTLANITLDYILPQILQLLITVSIFQQVPHHLILFQLVVYIIVK